MKIAICANCLETYEAQTYGHGLQIGGEYGSQRDPSYHYIDVCGECQIALQSADFATIHNRFRKHRTVALGAGGVVEQ